MPPLFLVEVIVSSFRMVPSDELLSICAPEGLLRVIVNVSSFSGVLSPLMATTISLLVSVAAKLIVPAPITPEAKSFSEAA